MEDKEPRTPKHLRDIARLILEELKAEAWETYTCHGSPFGDSMEALELWFEYEQYTTVN